MSVTRAEAQALRTVAFVMQACAQTLPDDSEIATELVNGAIRFRRACPEAWETRPHVKRSPGPRHRREGDR